MSIMSILPLTSGRFEDEHDSRKEEKAGEKVGDVVAREDTT